MRVFVTGAEGFVGGHLLEHLVAAGDEVGGTALSADLLGEHIPEGVTVRECDITQPSVIGQIVSDFSPGAIVHLAAVSSVAQSRRMPELTARVNVVGTVNLLEAASASGRPRTLVISSSEVYGPVAEDECPVSEEHPVNPQSLYATSKLCAEMFARHYVQARKLPVVILRPFNHTGPRQSPLFVCSSFARQIAMIEAGRSEPVLKVGNLEARRDFLDVRDVVRAYRLALQSGDEGATYNICSGTAVSVRHILDVLLSLSDARIEVRVSEELLRPLDLPVLLGSHERFTKATGWEPAIRLETTLSDLLEYWRRQFPPV